MGRTTVASPTPALQALDEQLADFRRLLELGLQQRECLTREDLAGVDRLAVSVHQVMRSIQLRQNTLSVLTDDRNAGLAQRQELHRLISEADAVRRQNQRRAAQLLAVTQEELRRLGRRRQAARGYAGGSSGRATADGRLARMDA